ncbi:HupE/UreJ family protein [Aestuariicella hydrocarbonica]|uniref:HupE/UreJ family protein n=2 Tax=Pseudomaricurvus hydrocarbonicus TaxID=1470433 RepID=A0A9E5MP71_9GAMM|nr:HupE/UreJ family protein [Aestuariicella hydrocarbonica]
MCVGVFGGAASADELRPAYLQLIEQDNQVIDVHWRVPGRGENQRLALNVLFGSEVEVLSQPFERNVSGSNLRDWKIRREQGLAGLAITIQGLEKTPTEVLARIEYRNGATLSHRFSPEAPSYQVPLQPGWSETVVTYFVLGVEHIVFGIDHLLFVFVLLLLVRSTRKLIATITAFTVAHSITLILAALELVVIPVPPVEACIALSIVFVATEIIRGQQGHPGLTERSPWIVAFAFGLLHGLGFAAALGEIGLPQNAILTALVVFNLGVEVGQLAFVAAVLVVWQVIQRLPVSIPVWAHRLPAYVVGSMASFWVFERVASFWN